MGADTILPKHALGPLGRGISEPSEHTVNKNPIIHTPWSHGVQYVPYVHIASLSPLFP
jgi:hypothetical protein